jgi:hypothetical protein
MLPRSSLMADNTRLWPARSIITLFNFQLLKASFHFDREILVETLLLESCLGGLTEGAKVGAFVQGKKHQWLIWRKTDRQLETGEDNSKTTNTLWLPPTSHSLSTRIFYSIIYLIF